MARVAFLFPGQGSQYVGMAKGLLEQYPQVRELFDRAEHAVDIPIRDLCSNGPMSQLTKTVNLQPCLTTVDVACAKILMDEGVQPDAVAGHSLGEYPALWACGSLNLEDCLRLVKRRGELMDKAAQDRPGAMAAIIGLERAQLEGLIQDILSGRDDGILALANHNSREQIVATGEKELVSILCKEVKALGKKAIPLKVSGGYHSPLMEEAARAFKEELDKISFSGPKIAIYSNVTAMPVDNGKELQELMARQICSPVRWFEIVNNMYKDGIKIFIETGPKKVLSNLVARSLDVDDIKVLNFEAPDDLEKIRVELGLDT